LFVVYNTKYRARLVVIQKINEAVTEDELTQVIRCLIHGREATIGAILALAARKILRGACQVYT
jgi:hypothetical protein